MAPRWKTLPSRYAEQAAKLGIQTETKPTTDAAWGSELAVLPDVRSEYEHQVALIEQCFEAWALNPRHFAGLNLIHASANGGLRKQGVAGQLKASGVQDGFPDLELPVARGGFFGLYIELKRPVTGTLSESQAAWRDALRAQGYKSSVCFGQAEAWSVIDAYYALAPTTVA